MPNLVTHYIVGQKVKNRLNIQSDKFLFGCILPDYIADCHFKEQQGRFCTPNISKYVRNHPFNDYDIFLGCLTHLLLDKYFVNDYVLKEIYDKRKIEENIFCEDKIYKEYSIISGYHLNLYNYSINDLVSCVNYNYPSFNIDKFNSDVSDAKNCVYPISELFYLDINLFNNFIESIVDTLVNDIITVQKKGIRRKMKLIRNNMLIDDVNYCSSVISDSLFNILDDTHDKYFIYSDFNNEVKTNDIIMNLLNKNKKVYLPKIVEEDMNAINYTKDSLLNKNEYGIYEPVGEHINIDDFVCVMPLLAIDVKGNRIGFGKGYYDKFLKGKNCLKIGICYDYQILDTIPNNEHDIGIDIIISEKRVIDLRNA